MNQIFKQRAYMPDISKASAPWDELSQLSELMLVAMLFNVSNIFVP